MNAFTSRAAVTLPRIAFLQSCRRTTGRRQTQQKRTFRTTTILKALSGDPVDHVEDVLNPISSLATSPQIDKELPEPSEVIDDAAPSDEQSRGIEGVADAVENDAEKLNKLKDKSTYGSAVKRSRRNVRKVEETPRLEVPNWFFEGNVRLHEDLDCDVGVRPLISYNRQNTCISSSDQGCSKTEPTPAPIPNPPLEALSHDRGSAHKTEFLPLPGPEPTNDSYMIDKDILQEIQTMVGSGLRPPSTRYADGYAASKPHLLLQSPTDGGIFFLDAVVRHVAAGQSADVISIDAQDIAAFAAEYVGDIPETPANSLSSLGYDTHLMMARNDYVANDENTGEDEEYDDLDDVANHQARNKPPSYNSQSKTTILPLVTIFGKGRVSDFLGSGTVDSASVSRGSSDLANAFAQDPSSLPSTVVVADKVRIQLLLEALLDAAYAKRKIRLAISVDDPTKDLSTSTSELIPNSPQAGKFHNPSKIQQMAGMNTIILVKDYAEMNATRSGGALLSKLHEVVTRKRKDGQRVLIVGTTSSEDLLPSLSKTGFNSLQTDSAQGPYRTIVTPCRTNSMFALDWEERTRQINMRHLQDMIRRLGPNLQQTEKLVTQPRLVLDSSILFASGLEESVWSFERVHRAALMILGTVEEGKELTLHHFTYGLTMLDLSDNAKADWLVHTKEQEQKHNLSMLTGNSSSDAKKELDDRIKKIRKHCNSHEKKLLNGVVDAANIHTTFADIQAPTDTIEALKTLTTLSLLRPDAFTYGVLATDKIPGLLLYGPPGTGKTLLAKAVAKESGATVLEVSGADVYDMYVGEGEKNVKAIFTLAKKLASSGGCVIFIDEADAIFGSRGTSTNRTSHRELINQFLREWDGLNDLSAFIMVATNRPFDLDDAVLRRLPRRLLVDLPTENDREAILQIHLKHEVLDSSVSLSHLASQTPFYSGSDLKNLAVAAALACVREENEAAVAHSGSEPFEYPKQRTLTRTHFVKAMEEISASVSEDMSSLSAIRKFDEKYGDRRGRRKKSSGYGFGTLTEMEKNNTNPIRIRA
ncbi:hypothetical protein MMC18_005342 [Xylographa bjoerkii]|nr:hypothetical protein [Xylographa bjoerkii]